MVLSKDTNPAFSVYHIGALLLHVLQGREDKEIDFIEAYNDLNSIHTISMQLYMFAIDWLYMLGIVDLGPKLSIKKCF